MWELDHKEVWAPKKWCFQLWCWRKILRVPWTARSNQLILKEINAQYSLEGLTWWWSFNTLDTDVKSQLIWKGSKSGKDWGQKEKRITEDEMLEWHHWLYGHEFEQIPRDGEGQGSLACCSPWGSQRVRQDWVTEQQQILSNSCKMSYFYTHFTDEETEAKGD